MTKYALLLMATLLVGACLKPLYFKEPRGTYFCDNNRQVEAAFDPYGSRAAIMYERQHKILDRVTKGDPDEIAFTDGVVTLHVEDEGHIWITKDNIAQFWNCQQGEQVPVYFDRRK